MTVAILKSTSKEIALTILGASIVPMFGYCHIQRLTSRITRMATGIITMKLKYAAPLLAVTSRVPTKQGTVKWWTATI